MIEHVDCWATNILVGKMQEKNLVDETSNLILQNYGTFKCNKNDVVGEENIFEKGNFENFINKIVEPSFNCWTEKNLNKKLKDFRQFKYKGWITDFMNKNSFIPTHNHTGSQLSSVFYLLNEETDKGGEIIFYDPRFNASRGYDNTFKDLFKPLKYTCETYKFLIFPSFLYHETTPFYGSMRLALVVDLFVN